ncbi:MAG TPA: ATP-binding protein [Polyangia bacterium]|nr:ATP-binding protein [Polyangia bacterium]
MKKSGGRSLVIAMMFVTASFVVASLYTLWLGRHIHAEARSLRSNAMPSVEWLITSRNRLLQITACLGESTDAASTNECIDRARRQLDQGLATYDALPDYPGEQALFAGVRRELAALDDKIDGYDLAAASSRSRAERERTLKELLSAIQRTDASIGELTLFNAAHGNQHADRIEELWLRSAVVEFALDGVCILFAAIATVLAVRAMRRYMTFLEDKTRELEWFAGTVAHDVLSPLAAVGIAVPVLKDRHPEDETTQRMAERALASLRRVRLIVDGILEFARSGAQPSSEHADVGEVVAGAMSELGEQAESANVKLSAEPIADARVACSPGVLTSVLSNLVRNAIKYMGGSVERRITVRVTARRRRVVFEVEDTGPGLPEELQAYVFEPYARLPGSKQPGLGLGLATVKRFVLAHGGLVGVRSSRGAGAVFWFELPRVVEEAALPVATT